MRVDELVDPVTALGESAVLALTYVNHCAYGVLEGGRETEELREVLRDARQAAAGSDGSASARSTARAARSAEST